MTIKENKGIQMKETKIINNQVTLIGEITTNFKFSHKVRGEGFYTAMIANERTSGWKDIIPVMVSERIMDVKENWIGKSIKVIGQFRSYNWREEEKSRLILSVFAREVGVSPEDVISTANDKNEILLDGHICKQPIYRKTPLGREIADILLAVNRPYGKTDYLPTIFWGRNARFVSTLPVGQRLKVDGRIQSRTYIKQISKEETEERTAYEVSASKVEVSEN